MVLARSCHLPKGGSVIKKKSGMVGSRHLPTGGVMSLNKNAYDYLHGVESETLRKHVDEVEGKLSHEENIFLIAIIATQKIEG